MFCCCQTKIQNIRYFFDTLITITLGINMITRKMTSFSSSISWYILFLYFKTFKIQSPLCMLFCSVKYTFNVKNDTFKPVKMDILFINKICYILVYNITFSQFDTNLVLIPWSILVVDVY